jgi:hypothetical protein
MGKATRTEPGLPADQKYRTPQMNEPCAVCSKPYGFHGAVDWRCPGEKVGAEWVPAETFFTPPRGRDGND